MNIVRTRSLELAEIPAIAFKQKLSSGGAGLKLLRLDTDASAVFTLDKRTGDAIPYGTYDESLFPQSAIDEAIEATSGLPYALRTNIKIEVDKYEEKAEVEAQAETAAANMIDSDEYAAIIDRYSDEKGKLNYKLLNKDFIQFASKSKTVADMIAAKSQAEDILIFVVKSRAAFITGKKESLDDAHTSALIGTLDEIDPRSAFKELKNHLKRMLARK